MSRFQIFIRELDGAFLVKNSLGQFFTRHGLWSYDPKLAQVFDNLETAKADAEAVLTVTNLLRPPQVFRGSLIVRLHATGRPRRVRDVVSHLRDCLTLKMDYDQFGFGGTSQPCLTTTEIDWQSFTERKTDQLEFSFS